jgi:hypothetical protein
LNHSAIIFLPNINSSLGLDMVVQAYNPSICGVEAGGSRDRGQPGLHSEILFQEKTNKKCIWVFMSIHEQGNIHIVLYPHLYIYIYE